MFLRIEQLREKKLAGHTMTMSLVENQTGKLWSGFMPKRKEISEQVCTLLYSLQVYPPGYFESFNPATVFDKWALVEIGSHDVLPDGIVPFILPAGSYAVFLHKGTSAQFPETARFIFQEWLPASGYRLDNRPHFERLGETYMNNHPDSEEEIWIPIL